MFQSTVDGVFGQDGLNVQSPVMEELDHVLDFVTALLLNQMDNFALEMTLV